MYKQFLHAVEVTDIVVAAFSYGGVPAGCAIRGLSKSKHLVKGGIYGVSGIVYLTAVIVAEGQTVIELFGDELGRE